MYKQMDVVQGRAGDSIVGAIVKVTSYPDGDPVQIWAVDDQDEPVIPDSEVETDDNGNYEYYAPTGRYIESVYVEGRLQYQKTDVQITEGAGFFEPLVSVIPDATTERTCTADDANGYIRMTNASANEVIIPDDDDVDWASISLGNPKLSGIQAGTGQTTVSGAPGVTVNYSSTNKTRAQFSMWTAIRVGTNEWDLTGDLAAS